MPAAFAVLEQRADRVRGAAQRDAVLRTLGAGDRGLERAEIELERLRVLGLVRRVVPEALHLGVGLDEANLMLGPAGQAQVGERLFVDREDRAGRAVFGAHVAERGAV